MIERCGQSIDRLEVTWNGPQKININAMREPERERPKDIPADMLWFPDIRARPALISMDEADPNGELRKSVTDLARAIPYRNLDETWPYGVPSIELGREGASIKMPYSTGTIAIYSEGREKKPEHPYWTNLVSVYHDRRHVAASDILAAGGVEAYVLSTLLDDPYVETPSKIQPINRKLSGSLMCAHLPLDTYT